MCIYFSIMLQKSAGREKGQRGIMTLQTLTSPTWLRDLMICQNSFTWVHPHDSQIYVINTTIHNVLMKHIIRTIIKNSSSKTLWWPPCHPSLPSLLIHRSHRLWRCRRCWCHWCCRRGRRRWYHRRGLRSDAGRLCWGRLWRWLPEHMGCCGGWVVGWLVGLGGWLIVMMLSDIL